MNSLPGLLIEYFINGVIAIIWIVLAFFPDLIQIGNSTYFIFIPIVYVLGMFIDVLAYLLTIYPKNRLREIWAKKARSAKANSDLDEKELKVLIAAKYPTLMKEIDNRSSRDRICRGMIVNSIGIVLFFRGVDIWSSLLLLFTSITMWIIFEKQSYKYLINSAKVVAKLRTKKNEIILNKLID